MRRWMMGLLLAACAAPALADETAYRQWSEALDGVRGDGVLHTAIGVTRQDTPIRALISRDDLDPFSPKLRVLLVGALDGSPESAAMVVQLLDTWYAAPERAARRRQVALSAVPCANPDALRHGLRGDNGSGGNPTRGYPPQGEAYHSRTDPEAAYLWRWIGMHAPDLVVEVVAEPNMQSTTWQAGLGGDPAAALVQLLQRLSPVEDLPAAGTGLVQQLDQHKPSHTGSVPALRVRSGDPALLETLLAAVDSSGFRGPSPARAELQQRVARTPLEVLTQLEPHYGHELPKVEYIPAVAMIARLRLGELTNNASLLADVQRIVEPYTSGKQSATGASPSASVYSGHLIFGELAKATGNPRYTQLVCAVADRGFDVSGKPHPSMPSHSEMSDSVFMHCPILAHAGRLTGEEKYYDMCLRHLQFMLKLNLRQDGLHRHSPLDEAAWGRGNGFPALGLALVLSELPEEHPIREEVLREHRNHLRALLPHQDPTGAWHQVVDDPASYRELTSTCMITFALARGVRQGWLDRAEFDPTIQRGWQAVKTRLAADGSLVDVCTGTGKQKSKRDYYDRTAILGQDPRGGAMSMLLAAEMAAYEQAQ